MTDINCSQSQTSKEAQKGIWSDENQKNLKGEVKAAGAEVISKGTVVVVVEFIPHIIEARCYSMNIYIYLLVNSEFS